MTVCGLDRGRSRPLPNCRDFCEGSSRIGDRHLVDLVPMLIDNCDKPARPIPARQGPAVKVARERERILPRSSIARQVNASVVVENLVAIGEMEIVTRHEWPPRGGTSELITPPARDHALRRGFM